jgi:DNA-binding PadR family transcriptional regulator
MSNPLTVRGSALQVLLAGPAYGSELIARFAGRTGRAAHLASARVYPVLRALEEEGLLKAVRVTPRGRRGARMRVYYALTPAGRRSALADRRLIQSLVAPAPAEDVRAVEKARMASRLLESEALSTLR